MRWFGLLLLTAGFLWGTIVAVRDAQNVVDWAAFLPGVVVGAIGVFLARRGAHLESTEESAVAANVKLLHGSLGRVAEGLAELERGKAEIDIYDLHGVLDERFAADLAEFADARKSMIPQYGLDAYAAVMNDFAAGERYLNRVWSCSVDGYIDEAHEFLVRARDQLVAAREKLDACRRDAAGPGPRA